MGSFSHIRSAAKSDVGRKRKNNEDAVGAWPNFGLFCIADGMGGGDDGEIASSAIVRGLDGIAASIAPRRGGAHEHSAVLGLISQAINAVSAWIYERAVRRQLKGCGSTFVGICFDAANPSAAKALHAGDSRLYRFRAGDVEQLTKDHSVAAMIGAKDEKEINPMFRGMILRAVGVSRSVDLEMTSVEVKEDDLYVLCSDGLYRMIVEKRMAELVNASTDVDAIATALVDAANEAGGIDNVSVVVLRVGKLPPPLEIDSSLPLPQIGSFSFSEEDVKSSPAEKSRVSVHSTLAWIRKIVP